MGTWFLPGRLSIHASGGPPRDFIRFNALVCNTILRQRGRSPAMACPLPSHDIGRCDPRVRNRGRTRGDPTRLDANLLSSERGVTAALVGSSPQGRRQATDDSMGGTHERVAAGSRRPGPAFSGRGMPPKNRTSGSTGGAKAREAFPGSTGRETGCPWWARHRTYPPYLHQRKTRDNPGDGNERG